MTRLEHFTAADDERTRTWARAVPQMYHGADPDETRLSWLVDSAVADGAMLTGAYEDAPGVDGRIAPVGTFAAVPGTLNLGGAPVTASLIASVGVRPTHRRQGLLRRMMEQSLRSSADAGVPLSILTASEGGIYERFGFGAAVWRGPLRLDVRSGLRLRASGRGSVHEVDPHWLMDRAPTVFERFHTRSFGSVSRRAEFLGDVLFEPTGDRLSALVRAAVHLGENGEVDGFAFYRPSTAWAHSLEILDLIALTPDAYLGLWALLGNTDLVDTLTFDGAVLDEPIRHAVVDPRTAAVTGVHDSLWVRVLDPVAALGSRRYRGAVAETIVLDIRDDLGHAAGLFEVEVRGGAASVRRVEAAAPDVTMDVATLGVLLLGTVTATELERSSRLTLAGVAAGERLDAVFAPTSPPRFYSQF